MKLKHYYNMYYNKIRDEEETLSRTTMYSLLNKLCKMNGTPISSTPNIDITTPLPDMLNQLGADFSPVVATLYSMGLEDLDYMKYYMLDKLTNGRFIDTLISSLFYSIKTKKKIMLIQFTRANFTMGSDQPTVIVEYKLDPRDNVLKNTMIVYANPFNGDMELEDFLSFAVADPIFLLDPERNSLYLLERLNRDATVIPYSQGKMMNLLPLKAGANDSYATYYMPSLPAPILMGLSGDPVYRFTSSTKAEIINSNPRVTIDLYTLTL